MRDEYVYEDLVIPKLTCTFCGEVVSLSWERYERSAWYCENPYCGLEWDTDGTNPERFNYPRPQRPAEPNPPPPPPGPEPTIGDNNFLWGGAGSMKVKKKFKW